MPIASIRRLMNHARDGRYAVGYFESWSLESLQGVVDAAELVQSPIIIGFNGEFLSERADADVRELNDYAAMGLAVASRATVPIGFIFNECRLSAWTERAITAGFNLIMPAPGTPRADVRRLAGLAHDAGLAIEAEADMNGDALDEPFDGTDPDEAARFVDETEVDLLAVEVGNEEIKLSGRLPLDLDRLKAISRRVDVPLVLHGGTGIEDASLQAAIKLGVRKINFGTYMKQRYLSDIKRALEVDDENPHTLLGGGANTDLMVVGRRIVRDAVLERIDLLGSTGKA